MSGGKEDCMIERFYKRSHTLRYLRSGVTGPYMDEYAKHIADIELRRSPEMTHGCSAEVTHPGG